MAWVIYLHSAHAMGLERLSTLMGEMFLLSIANWEAKVYAAAASVIARR